MSNKTGLLIMSHGDFAQAIMGSAELIVGKQENYETLGVHLEDSVDELRQRMQDKVERLDTSEGLVVFTDILGGTPMNLAGSLLARGDVLVCSGVNLPVLLEFSMNRDKGLAQLETVIRDAYENGFAMRNSEVLKQEDEDDDLLL